MNCNGIHINLFIIVYLIVAPLQYSTGQQEISMDNDQTECKQRVSEHNLYNLFKQRLEKIRNEMNMNMDTNDPTTDIKNRFDVEKNTEKRSINDCFYEEFKSRVDKLFNDLSLNPSKTFKRKISALLNNSDPSSLNVRSCLYDEYKKRLAKLNNALLQYEQLQDIESIPSLYEEYKKRLDSADDGIYNADREVYDCQGAGGTPDNTDTQKSIFKVQQSPNEAFLNPSTKTNDITTDDISQPSSQIALGKRHRKDNVNVNVTTNDTGTNEYKLVNFNEPQEEEEENQLDDDEFNTNSWSKRNNDNNQVFHELINEAKPVPQTIFESISDSETFADERQSSDPEEDSDESEENIQKQVQQTPKLDDDNYRHVRFDSINGLSSYPTVLTKAFETNLGATSPTNLLATVAQKMNTSTLDLANRITSVTDVDMNAIRNDPQFASVLQKFLSNKVGVNANIATAAKPAPSTTAGSHPKVVAPPNSKPVTTTTSKSTTNSYIITPKPAVPSNVVKPKDRKPKETFKTTSKFGSSSTEEECEEVPDAVAANMTVEGTVGEILEKILTKLERIQQERSNATDKDSHPEGAPCDIIGSWNSFQMGIQFEISMSKSSDRQLGQAEKGNKLLTIEVVNCKPPKRAPKQILDVDWKFMGSAMKQYGGPLFLYTQQRADNILALFAGYCRTCGGMDTIFGSWTFLYPCKDCQDITTSIENRRDIFRRYRMDAKRKQRFKEILFQKSPFGKSDSCKPN